MTEDNGYVEVRMIINRRFYEHIQRAVKASGGIYVDEHDFIADCVRGRLLRMCSEVGSGPTE